MALLKRFWLLLSLLVLIVACSQQEEPEAVAPTPVPVTFVPPTLTKFPTPLPAPVLSVDNTPVPTAVPEQTTLFPSPAYSVHLAQWWHLDVLNRDLTLTNEMGFGWVKQNFAWRDIEKEKGAYDWWRPDEIVTAVENHNLNLIVRLDRQPLWSVLALPEGQRITPNQPPVDYQDFGNFCYAMADRYRGRIAAYQVWNEPNLSREWGDRPPSPIEYTDLLRVCYEGIKTADPQAIVISAGLAPTGSPPPDAIPDIEYFQAMYDAGAAAYFDVLGVNAPGYKAPPELAPEDALDPIWGGHRWNVFRHVEDIRNIMVQNGDADKQIAILEMGWMLHQEYHEPYKWHGVTEQEQADYLVGAYQYARENWQPWIGLMNMIYFSDYNWTPEEHEQYWWSIVLPDGTLRPAYSALQAMEK